MVEHKCLKCNKIFKQKVHLDNHNKRKRPCKKTSSNVIINVTPSITKHQTYPLSWYHDTMAGIFDFVVKELHPAVLRGEKDIKIAAEVKTGKRYIAQAYSTYTTPIVGIQNTQSYVHVFISSWVRRDDDNQRKMLNIYFKGSDKDPRVFKINTEKSKARCIKKIKEIVATHDKVIVHHDELDYGSGSEQHMAAVYEYCISQEKIYLISYSASYEEATIESSNSNSISRKQCILKFEPPEEYRGAKWFIENNMVSEAKPFFETNEEQIILSESAKALLERAKLRLSSDNPKENCKKLLIVRMNTGFEQTKELIEAEKIPELCSKDDIRIIREYIHSRRDLNSITVKWDDYSWWKRKIENYGVGKFLLILFIDQCSTRSTDWFCHPWLSAYHDYHPAETPINTCIQSNLRVVYYTNKMCEGVKVYNDEEFYPELHGQKEVIEYVAGIKTLSQIARPVSSRTKVFEKLRTFGHVIMIRFSEQELTDLPIIQNLSDITRQTLEEAIRAKLKSTDRNILKDRTLKGKRKFTMNGVDAGGIYTVALNHLRNINSGPGGGVGALGGEVYNNRGEYFWADVALDDLETTNEGRTVKIHKGTTYITYGIADRPIDDDSEDDDISTVSSTSEFAHRVTGKSMYVPK